MSDKIAVLPLGAYEYHGPHLPFDTDNVIATALVEGIKTRLPSHLDVDFLPVETIGYSPEHQWHTQTRTLDWQDALTRWIDIGHQCAQQGIKRFVMLNAHGGNSPFMTIVATQLRMQYNMLAVATHWSRFGLPDGLITPAEKALDIHAGFIETSLMLAIAPDKVRMDLAQDFKNNQADFAHKFQHLRAYGPHAFGWDMRDLNPQGAVGNALKATKQAGQQILQHAVLRFIELLEDVQRFDFKRDFYNPD